MKAYVVSHTHWDRAWYLPWQRFRHHLLATVEQVLDVLERNPDFRAFLLDGQVAAVEDYLALRPADRRRIEQLVRAARLQIGPWYVLPDEFLVSGESLIRNLQRGLREAAGLGGAMRIGYVPDSFGHVAQLPQILRGFGIDAFVFMRGLDEDAWTRLGRDFVWVAPDGSRVRAFYLRDGYFNAAAPGFPVRAGHPAPLGDFAGSAPDPALAREQLELAIRRAQVGAHAPALLLMNGMDHMPIEPSLPALIGDAAAVNGVELVHASLSEFVHAARSGTAELPEHSGELRGNAHHPILAGVFSARVYLKQANHRAETLLEKHAEPLVALLDGDGTRLVPELDEAWRHLLLCHAHDDICGCSVDEVHADDVYRFRQAEQLALAVIDDAATRIAHDAGARYAPAECTVLIHNAAPYAVRRVLRVPAFFPETMSAGGRVRAWELGGREVETELLSAPRAGVAPVLLENPEGAEAAVALEARLPAAGYALYRLAIEPVDVPVESQHTGTAIENGMLRIHADASGALRVERDGVAAFAFLRLEDAGDAGDTYSYSAPEQDAPRVLRFDGAEVVHAGTLLQVLRARYTLETAAALDDERRVETAVQLELELGRGSAELRIRVQVENAARDHRLRLHVDSAERHAQAWTGGHFGIERRGRPAPAALERWTEAGERAYPTQFSRDFVLLRGTHTSLLVAHRGLHEYELVEGERGTSVALTLLRAVGMLSRTGGRIRRVQAGPALPTPGAQCIGFHEMQLSVSWIPGGIEPYQAAALAEEFTAEPLAQVVRLHPRLKTETRLPPSDSLVRIEPARAVALSALRLTGDGAVVVRVYNRTAEAQETRIEIARRVGGARLCDLEEKPIEALPLSGSAVALRLPPAAIRTVRFEPG